MGGLEWTGLEDIEEGGLMITKYGSAQGESTEGIQSNSWVLTWGVRGWWCPHKQVCES